MTQHPISRKMAVQFKSRAGFLMAVARATLRKTAAGKLSQPTPVRFGKLSQCPAWKIRRRSSAQPPWGAGAPN